MRKIIAFILVLAFVGISIPTFIPQPVYAVMFGSGTADDPYTIHDVNDLQDMSNNLSAYYELANDIDAVATYGWNGGAGFEPIGNSSSPFTGFFDGNNYIISNLYINRPSTQYVGLFGYCEGNGNATAMIQDVILYGSGIFGAGNYTGSATCVGTLAGYVLDGVVQNVDAVAGVVNCTHVDGTHAHLVGGLVGCLDSDSSGIARIVSCSSSGLVITQYGVSPSSQYVGGLVGHLNYFVGDSGIDETGIWESWSSCVVAAQSNYRISAGGLIGSGVWSSMEVLESFATGDVIVDAGIASWSDIYAGGFIGWYIEDQFGDHIEDCYARGDVMVSLGDDLNVGGFAGRVVDESGLVNCYSTGNVTADEVAGLVAHFGTNSYAMDCFWDIETSGTTDNGSCGHPAGCGEGKNTTDMKTESTFTDEGWDFVDTWAIDGSINDGYPYLQWYEFSWEDYDIYQVLWFQPNDIIEGTTLPDRKGTEDGIITWGANPAGITISHSELIPEEEYEFEPVIPDNRDIIKPEPEIMTGDVNLERLRSNPLYPLVQILSIDGFLNERLVWLGLAWSIVIVAMLGVHLGFDTRKNTEKPQHFILTTITGLGLSILFYTWGIFPLWVIILMSFGLGGAIIWERQPVI